MKSADREEEMRREIVSLEELADTFAQVMPSDFASEEELELWEKEARERAAALTRALSDMKLTNDIGDGRPGVATVSTEEDRLIRKLLGTGHLSVSVTPAGRALLARAEQKTEAA